MQPDSSRETTQKALAQKALTCAIPSTGRTGAERSVALGRNGVVAPTSRTTLPLRSPDLLGGRHARVPDIPMDLPLPSLDLPHDDVLAVVELLPAFARQGVCPDLVGRVATRLDLEGDELHPL